MARSVAKGALAGAVGGLLGSWAMSELSDPLSRAAKRLDRSGDQSKAEALKNDAPATVQAARKVAGNVLHHPLGEDAEQIAGGAVHFGFGTAVGALYGAAAELQPRITWGVGIPFAAALWLMADEVAVPAAGLSRRAGQYPLSTHVRGLLAHFVYGLTTEVARTAMRRIIR